MSQEVQTVIGPRPRGYLVAALRNPTAAITRRVRNTAICLAAIVVAFHYSLSTLLRTLRYDTPLAYLSLVPVVSLFLAIRRMRPQPDEPAIHDRQVDYIVAIPLLLGAVAIMLWLPPRMSSMFWVQRYDLLALPLFVAGVVALLFGVRVLMRLKLPILFLFLAWPVPYTTFLLREIDLFTKATQAALTKLVHLIPIAKQTAGATGTEFLVKHGHSQFSVSVVSSCSGVSSVVGFALIGGAMLSEFRGTRTRKTLWFLVGALVVWIVNVLRVFSIIAIGKLAGQHIAIDVLHPVLGLFTFAAGMVLMLLIAGWFGLELKWLDKPAKSMPPSGLGGSVADPARRERPEAVKRTAVALVIVISLGLVLGGSNQTLRKFDLVADASGAPRLAAFLNYPSRVQGWRALHTASYDWVRSLFGTDANWFRYQYQWNARQAAFLRTASPVYADVISTSDPGALSTYGVEACYRFHGYNLKSDRIVDLGGLYGKVVSYHNDSKNVDWTAVYWQWPVQSPSGTKYERVTLILANTQAVVVGQTALNGYQTGRITAPKPREGQTPKELALQQSEQFLVAFAKQLVAHQPAAA